MNLTSFILEGVNWLDFFFGFWGGIVFYRIVDRRSDGKKLRSSSIRKNDPSD